MKNTLKLVGIGLCGVFAAGCITTGLSTRETRGHNYSTYLYALYDGADSTAGTRPTLHLPAKVALAQIGEVAPPQAMLEALQQEVGLFRRVEGIPGVFDLERTDGWHGQPIQEKPEESRQRAQSQIRQMVRFARDLGMDYLFLYGGSIDYGSRETPWTLLDLTLVGGYLIPSHEMSGTARASGALVDLATERVLFVVSAESSHQDHAATALVDGKRDRFLETLRDETVSELTQQLLERLRRS